MKFIDRSAFDFNLIKKRRINLKEILTGTIKSLTECIDEKSSDDLNDVFKKTALY